MFICLTEEQFVSQLYYWSRAAWRLWNSYTTCLLIGPVWSQWKLLFLKLVAFGDVTDVRPSQSDTAVMRLGCRWQPLLSISIWSKTKRQRLLTESHCPAGRCQCHKRLLSISFYPTNKIHECCCTQNSCFVPNVVPYYVKGILYFSEVNCPSVIKLFSFYTYILHQ